MPAPLNNAILFLVQTVFELYITLVLLRLVLQIVRAPFYNPICQFIVKLTDPLIKPLRKFIPGVWGIDSSSVVLVFILECIKICVLVFLKANTWPDMGGLALWALGASFQLGINIFFWAIIIQVLLSWIQPMSGQPINEILYKLTEPLLGRARNILPHMGGIDLSPIPVLILLQLLIILVTSPIISYGMALSLG